MAAQTIDSHVSPGSPSSEPSPTRTTAVFQPYEPKPSAAGPRPTKALALHKQLILQMLDTGHRRKAILHTLRTEHNLQLSQRSLERSLKAWNRTHEPGVEAHRAAIERYFVAGLTINGMVERLRTEHDVQTSVRNLQRMLSVWNLHRNRRNGQAGRPPKSVLPTLRAPDQHVRNKTGYTPVYPTTDFPEARLRQTLSAFYRCSDDQRRDEEWVGFFVEDATVIIGQKMATGRDEIRALRHGMWETVAGRKHSVEKVFPARFESSTKRFAPKGWETRVELMLYGEVKYTALFDGEQKLASWSALAVMQRKEMPSGGWRGGGVGGAGGGTGVGAELGSRENTKSESGAATEDASQQGDDVQWQFAYYKVWI